MTTAHTAPPPATEEAGYETDPAADDATLRSGVAATYSLSGFVSLLVLIAWIVLCLADHRFIGPSNVNFFATSAQVLPVLLLAFAIERVFFERSTSRLATRASAIVAFGTVLVLAAVGEILALVAIAWSDPPPAGIRVVGGLVVLVATAGSLTLIIGFAAVRSGVVLDLRSGLRLIRRGRALDAFDPRASTAARATAALLALAGVVLALLLTAGAVGFAIEYARYEETAAVVTLSVFALLVAAVIAAPGVLYLNRVAARRRKLRAWRESISPEGRRFEALTSRQFNRLSNAPRQVFLARMVRLVDDGTPLADWPAALGDAQDDRLSPSEQAELRAIRTDLEEALRTVESERQSSKAGAAGPAVSPETT